jgi:hypothetical protein
MAYGYNLIYSGATVAPYYGSVSGYPYPVQFVPLEKKEYSVLYYLLVKGRNFKDCRYAFR